ncbi:hypothetical protein ACFWEN_43815, partial [Streptomyces anthocyanicus]
LHPVHGYDPGVTALATGATLQGPAPTRTPAVHGATRGPVSLFAALASLTDTPSPAPAAALAEVEVADGTGLRVRWWDGTVTRLAPEPYPPY